MRVLITGITGMAGSFLAEYIADQHPDVEVFGTFRWRGEAPAAGSLRFSFRSGVSAEPDRTWSAWTEAKSAGGKDGTNEISLAELPRGRYVQWRAEMHAEGGASPLLYGAELSYRQENLKPRIDLLGSNDLWLDIQPTHYAVGNKTLYVSAAEGPTGNLVGLFLTAVNGAPTFALLAVSNFDATGRASWSGTVPPGYSGNSFDLRSFAIGRTGKLVDSLSETIAIQ